MKFRLLFSAVWIGTFCLNGIARAESMRVELVSISPHPSIGHKHVCMVVKIGEENASDCDEPKCLSGGEAVDMALASKGLKMACKTIDVNATNGFDVTYKIYGAEFAAWTANDPEPELSRIGLTVRDKYTPTDPACLASEFEDENTASEGECSHVNENIGRPRQTESKPSSPPRRRNRNKKPPDY